MASLPIFQSTNQVLLLLQNKWKSIIEPVIQNELNQGQLIQASLKAGVTVVNHKLGRKQIGYLIADIDAPASIYRSAPLNETSLTLTSSQACNVSLWVY